VGLTPPAPCLLEKIMDMTKRWIDRYQHLMKEANMDEYVRNLTLIIGRAFVNGQKKKIINNYLEYLRYTGKVYDPDEMDCDKVTFAADWLKWSKSHTCEDFQNIKNQVKDYQKTLKGSKL
jgi:hypothetical protein